MNKEISVYVGDKVTLGYKFAVEDVATKAKMSNKNLAIFMSIVQTWASWIPESYIEEDYNNDDHICKYTINLKTQHDKKVSVRGLEGGYHQPCGG